MSSGFSKSDRDTAWSKTKLHPKQIKKMRVLIADEHPVVRYGLKQLINQQPDLCVCASVPGMTKALQIIESNGVDLVITGVFLRSGSGIDFIKHVKMQFKKLPIMVLSMQDESLFAERALRAGACGYLMKSEPVEKILASIRRALDDNICVSESILNQLLKHQRAAVRYTSKPTCRVRSFSTAPAAGCR